MSDVKPALTPEEWEEFKETGRAPSLIPADANAFTEFDVRRANQREAAVRLYLAKSLGFTWGDVRELRFQAQHLGTKIRTAGVRGWTEEDVAYNEEVRAKIVNLADRIEALLPPGDS